MRLSTIFAVFVLVGIASGLAGKEGKVLESQSAAAVKAQAASASKQAAKPVAESDQARLEREVRELKATSDKLTSENARLRERIAQLESELGRKAGTVSPAAAPMPPKAPEQKSAGMPQQRQRDPGVEKRILEADERYKLEGGHNSDRGRTYVKFGPPSSVETKEGVEIWRYAEQPGVGKNVEIRFGGPSMKTIWVKMDRK
jgi:hypothetical protein